METPHVTEQSVQRVYRSPGVIQRYKMPLSRVEISDPPELTAGPEAMEFLSSVGPDELRLCLFSETLSSISESGAELGAFSAKVQPAYYEGDGRGEEQKCFLVHISSQSSAHEVPCGGSITAYISPQLETLEQNHHEYIQLRGNSLDKKTLMRRRGDRMEVSRVITEGQHVHQEKKSYDLSALSGFISEASNLLILRLLARRKKPEHVEFLTFDAEMNLCILSYRSLGSCPQLIGRDTVEVFGVERALLSDDAPVTWQYYFLPDGHLTSRVQVGSPVTIKISQMPILSEPEEEDPKPQFDQNPLSWEEDAQLYPEFLERKEGLMSDHMTYLRRHPEIKALMADFTQFLLLRKPRDVFTFAAEFFGSFSSAQERGQTFRSSSNPLHDESGEQRGEVSRDPGRPL